MRQPLQIVKAVIRYYRDNEQYRAIIHWSDGSITDGAVSHKPSCFLMRWQSFELGTHMRALFARIEREGFKSSTRRGEVAYTP